MPRVTLYVPDDLKTRMDDAGEAINWSAVAQRAFREAVLTQAMRKEPHDMTNVVERLRASREKVEAKEFETGKDRGAMWAKHRAEYDQLLRVVEYDGEWSEEEDGDHAVLESLIDPENELDPREWGDNWGQQRNPSDAFVRGFVEGANEVYVEIRDQL
jgi:hypothetical protein